MSDEVISEPVVKKKISIDTKSKDKLNADLYKTPKSEKIVEKEIVYPTKTKIKKYKIREFKTGGKKPVVKSTLIFCGKKKK